VLSLDTQQLAGGRMQVFLTPFGRIFNLATESEVEVVVRKFKRADEGLSIEMQNLAPLLQIPAGQYVNLKAAARALGRKVRPRHKDGPEREEMR